MTPDAVLVDVEGAMEALGQLTGRSVREDVTGRIFERFCVGKSEHAHRTEKLPGSRTQIGSPAVWFIWRSGRREKVREGPPRQG